MRVKFRLPMTDYFVKLERKRQTEFGEEVVSSVPMAPPIGYNPQPSMIDHIRNLVRSEQLRYHAMRQGHETFEEADDFEVDDDPMPPSAYEFEDDLEPAPRASSRKPKAAAKDAASVPPSDGPGTRVEPAKPAEDGKP